MNIPDQPIAMSRQVHTYTELKQQIHDDLWIQHREWIEPTGECPECDEHEVRLMKLLDALTRTRPNESPLLRPEIEGADRHTDSAASDKAEAPSLIARVIRHEIP